jgi:hexosaminidase
MQRKKIIFTGILMALILLVVQCINVFPPSIQANASNQRRGVLLDCSRTYYNPSVIKKYIDLLKKDKGTYLQLHLNDNERYGVESDVLNQKTSNATKKGDVYYNKQTHLAFLTKSQLLDIIQYGYKNGIEVIPEIDLPGHDKSILRLLSYSKRGRQLVKKIENKSGDNEMYYNRKYTLAFSKKLLSEYTGMLPKGYHIVVGCDEITISDKKDQLAIVKYINAIDDFVNKRQLKLETWNDSFHKAVLKKYHKNILINYWSLTGEVSSKKDRKDNIRMRATLPELNKAGFQTINYNNYYLYIITEPTAFTNESRRIWIKELKAWNVNVWNDKSKKKLSKSCNNLGAALSIWGDYPNKYNGQQTYNKTSYFVNEFLNKMRFK